MGHLRDSLVNFVSGLGTSRDKFAATQFAQRFGDPQQLMNAYRGDWIARKAVDIPAFDAIRDWRDWQADDPQIEALEAEEERLGIRRKVMQALIRARLFGGSAIVLGTDDLDPAEELDIETLPKEGLRFIHVLNRFEITVGQLDLNVLSERYGQPEYYEVNSGSAGLVRLHPSRVIRFLGNEIPMLDHAPDGWGDSILQAIDDAVKQASSSAQGIASLIQEAKVDIIKVPQLMVNLSTDDYRQRLIERFQLANVSKGIVNTLILDSEEEWERVQQNFSALPDVMRIYLMIVSGAADIPATRMLGQSPTGLSSTGESDTRNYYDRIGSMQRTEISPALKPLDEALIRSALGTRPPEVHYLWTSLWQLTEDQKADVAHKKAQALQIHANSGLLPDEALSKGLQNQLVEDGVYPGLEAALADFDDWTPEEEAKRKMTEQAEVEAQFAAGQEARTNEPPR